jgi:hypothetical protein
MLLPTEQGGSAAALDTRREIAAPLAPNRARNVPVHHQCISPCPDSRPRRWRNLRSTAAASMTRGGRLPSSDCVTPLPISLSHSVAGSMRWWEEKTAAQAPKSYSPKEGRARITRCPPSSHDRCGEPVEGEMALGKCGVTLSQTRAW